MLLAVIRSRSICLFMQIGEASLHQRQLKMFNPIYSLF